MDPAPVIEPVFSLTPSMLVSGATSILVVMGGWVLALARANVRLRLDGLSGQIGAAQIQVNAQQTRITALETAFHLAQIEKTRLEENLKHLQVCTDEQSDVLADQSRVLERVDRKLDSKVSKGEMPAATAYPPRPIKREDSDPPPYRPRLPSRRSE